MPRFTNFTRCFVTVFAFFAVSIASFAIYQRNTVIILQWWLIFGFDALSDISEPRMSGDIFAVQKRYPQFRAGEIRFASDIRAFARVKDSYFSAVGDSTRGVPPRSE